MKTVFGNLKHRKLILKKRAKYFIFLIKTMGFKGLTYFNEIRFSCISYTVTIRLNKFKRNKLNVSSVNIATNHTHGSVN